LCARRRSAAERRFEGKVLDVGVEATRFTLA